MHNNTRHKIQEALANSVAQPKASPRSENTHKPAPPPISEHTRRNVLDAVAATRVATGKTELPKALPEQARSAVAEATALLRAIATQETYPTENPTENPTDNITEGFSLSVSTLDVMGKIYDAIARSHFQVTEALDMARGQEGTGLSPDAGRVLENASVHLRRAADEVYKAMRAVMPDVEYSAYRDMPV